jgi:sulfhydrogenase subunit beta (sulfur reductase)
MTKAESVSSKSIITHDGLERLIVGLAARGYKVLGPTVHDGAIVYEEVGSVDDLPTGWTDRQDAGRYRLERRPDAAVFGYAVGPQSWKRFLHPPIARLWRARRNGDGFTLEGEKVAPRYAFLGVRACELHAIAIQDRVFIEGQYQDVSYAKRRQDNFIVAVNCGEAGGTCFCASMQTGPKTDGGFDLALTELLDRDTHAFLVEVGSHAGAAVLAELPHHRPTAREIAAADAVTIRTAANMGRAMDTHGLKELLQTNPNHARWDDVARRCLTCANCTMVCPTCFCVSVEDHTSLDGGIAERVRRWDSCFTLDFSYIHGGSVRTDTKSRYRQWMTHKLAHWVDQFGTSGCVGCGRCITWCPVGIDITAEVTAIQAAAKEASHGRT